MSPIEGSILNIRHLHRISDGGSEEQGSRPPIGVGLGKPQTPAAKFNPRKKFATPHSTSEYSLGHGFTSNVGAAASG